MSTNTQQGPKTSSANSSRRPSISRHTADSSSRNISPAQEPTAEQRPTVRPRNTAVHCPFTDIERRVWPSEVLTASARNILPTFGMQSTQTTAVTETENVPDFGSEWFVLGAISHDWQKSSTVYACRSKHQRGSFLIKRIAAKQALDAKHGLVLLNELKVMALLQDPSELGRYSQYLLGPSKHTGLWAWRDLESINIVTVSFISLPVLYKILILVQKGLFMCAGKYGCSCRETCRPCTSIGDS